MAACSPGSPFLAAAAVLTEVVGAGVDVVMRSSFNGGHAAAQPRPTGCDGGRQSHRGCLRRRVRAPPRLRAGRRAPSRASPCAAAPIHDRRHVHMQYRHTRSGRPVGYTSIVASSSGMALERELAVR